VQERTEQAHGRGSGGDDVGRTNLVEGSERPGACLLEQTDERGQTAE
jgi:hypothetical protein